MNSQTFSKDTSEDGACGLGAISLLQIVQNLITLGLNSIELWNVVIPKLKIHDQFSQPELLNLQLLLVRIAQHLSTRLFDFFPYDLSQDKLPNILSKSIPSNEILKVLKPLLKKKSFCDKSFSSEASNILNSTVEEILASLKVSDFIPNEICTQEEVEIQSHSSSKRIGDETVKKVSKKRARSPSPSSSSAASSDSEGTHCESDSDSNSESDKFDKLFKVKSLKKEPIKIRQSFQTQKKRLRRKLTTPGEEGRYMVKIELTDTKDLKKCKLNQYWTKVSTKAVFLTEPKSQMFKQVDSMLYDIGRKIKSTQGVQCDEVKLDKKSK